MATYYVRKSGLDSNAGTSAGAAWATIGKALGAAGMASGDTVYLGAGIYNESITPALANPSARTSVIGDVHGTNTGDSGEIIWTPNTLGWFSAVPSSAPLILNKDYMTFQNITFTNGNVNNGCCIDATTTLTSFLKLLDCAFIEWGGPSGNPLVSISSAFGVSTQTEINRCFFWNPANSTDAAVSYGFTRSAAGVDYDTQQTISNCIIVAGTSGLDFGALGAGTIFGGGVTIDNCTIIASTPISLGNTNTSGTYPIKFKNCTLIGSSTVVNGAGSGKYSDEGGNVGSGAVSSVTTAVATSRYSTAGLLLSPGHEWIHGLPVKRFGTPMTANVTNLNHSDTTDTTDLTGRARPAGVGKRYVSSTATAGAGSTLTDSGAAWGTNQHQFRTVRLTGGTGSGQSKVIESNTATVLTMQSSWTTNPDNTSTYVIFDGVRLEATTASAGSATTITRGSASWATNQWQGYTVETTGGTGSGQTRTVTSNSATALTVAAWGVNPASGTTFIIYRKTGVDTIVPTSGAIERHDTAERESNIVDVPQATPTTYSIKLTGKADAEFRIPVNASSTTISVKAYYDTDHGTTNKPRAVLAANTELGTATETKTMTSGAGTWQTLTFSAITPNAKGWVTVRLEGRSDKVYGHAYFDTLTS